MSERLLLIAFVCTVLGCSEAKEPYVVLASSNPAVALAAGPTEVFWSSTDGWSGGVSQSSLPEFTFASCNGPSQVWKTPIAGGDTAFVALDKNGCPNSLVLDGGDLYFTALVVRAGPGCAGSGSVSRVSATGGAATVLASGLDCPVDLKLVGSDLYWLTTKGIMKMPRSGGTPTLLVATTDAVNLAAGADHLFWATKTGIMSISVQGGAATQIAAVPNDAVYLSTPYRIWVDGTAVYWSAAYLGPSGEAVFENTLVPMLYTTGLSGGTVTSLYSTAGARFTTELLTRKGHVYFGTEPEGKLYRMPTGGGTAEPIADVRPHRMAADDNHLYCTLAGTRVGTPSLIKIPIN